MLHTTFRSMLLLTIALPALIALSTSRPRSTVLAPPGTPKNIQISWKKDFKDPSGGHVPRNSDPICKLTLTVVPVPQATSYEWEISRFGSVEMTKNTQGAVWNVGYIEPTDTYTVKVRAVNNSGRSDWFSKSVLPPAGCFVK